MCCKQDAEPIAHHGKDFRVYKQLTADDHFFGLGDKPGPLDRAGEAFTMWNTDHFGWQESTDPDLQEHPVLHANAARQNAWRLLQQHLPQLL